MTGGTVVILGALSANAGAGMTGGELWIPTRELAKLNPTLVEATAGSDAQLDGLTGILRDYAEATGSTTARALLEDPRRLRAGLRRVASRRR
jgi:glutamate synthase (NADPH/NADH) large chain